MAKKPRVPISFKISAQYLELADKAAAQAGICRAEWLKRFWPDLGKGVRP